MTSLKVLLNNDELKTNIDYVSADTARRLPLKKSSYHPHLQVCLLLEAFLTEGGWACIGPKVKMTIAYMTPQRIGEFEPLVAEFAHHFFASYSVKSFRVLLETASLRKSTTA